MPERFPPPPNFQPPPAPGRQPAITPFIPPPPGQETFAYENNEGLFHWDRVGGEPTPEEFEQAIASGMAQKMRGPQRSPAETLRRSPGEMLSRALSSPLGKFVAGTAISGMAVAGTAAIAAPLGLAAVPLVGLAGFASRKLNTALGFEDPGLFGDILSVVTAPSFSSMAQLGRAGVKGIIRTSRAGGVVAREMLSRESERLGEQLFRPRTPQEINQLFDNLSQLQSTVPMRRIKRYVQVHEGLRQEIREQTGLPIERDMLERMSEQTRQTVQITPSATPGAPPTAQLIGGTPDFVSFPIFHRMMSEAGKEYRDAAKSLASLGHPADTAARVRSWSLILREGQNTLDDLASRATSAADVAVYREAAIEYRRFRAAQEMSALADAATTTLPDGTMQTSLPRMVDTLRKSPAFHTLRETLDALGQRGAFEEWVAERAARFSGGIVTTPAMVAPAIGAYVGSSAATAMGMPGALGAIAGVYTPEILGQFLLSPRGRNLVERTILSPNNGRVLPAVAATLGEVVRHTGQNLFTIPHATADDLPPVPVNFMNNPLSEQRSPVAHRPPASAIGPFPPPPFPPDEPR